MAEATRVAFGRALARIGDDPRIVVLDADLASSTNTKAFADEALAETGIPVRRHAVLDFGESGTGEALYAKHGLDAAGIAAVARTFVDDLRGAVRARAR
jgi:transketolase C-terminal domain/subunit